MMEKKKRWSAGRWKPVLDLNGYEKLDKVRMGYCLNCKEVALIVAMSGELAVCEDCWICNKIKWNKNGTKPLPRTWQETMGFDKKESGF